MLFPVSNPLRIRVHLELGGAVSLTALHAVSGMSRCLSHLPREKSHDKYQYYFSAVGHTA